MGSVPLCLGGDGRFASGPREGRLENIALSLNVDENTAV
jgi:hypothetical protein